MEETQKSAHETQKNLCIQKYVCEGEYISGAMLNVWGISIDIRADT